jgi:hypothetical protein
MSRENTTTGATLGNKKLIKQINLQQPHVCPQHVKKKKQILVPCWEIKN